jgi:hypothetical protein
MTYAAESIAKAESILQKQRRASAKEFSVPHNGNSVTKVISLIHKMSWK